MFGNRHIIVTEETPYLSGLHAGETVMTLMTGISGLRACANRRVAYVPTGATKAVGPPAELLALGSHSPIGVTAPSLRR